MELGIVFDWVLMIFLTWSGLIKVSGKERKEAQSLGVHYNWIILIGALQLVAIYFVYVNTYIPVLVLVGLPYLVFAVRCILRKEYVITAVLIGITAMIALRWFSLSAFA